MLWLPLLCKVHIWPRKFSPQVDLKVGSNILIFLSCGRYNKITMFDHDLPIVMQKLPCLEAYSVLLLFVSHLDVIFSAFSDNSYASPAISYA